MDFGRVAMDPGVAARRFAARLEEAGLARFGSAEHDTELDLLKVSWAHGVTLYMDLTHNEFMDPIDEHGRAVILGLQPCCEECAAFADDPRTQARVRGITVIPSADGHDASPDR